MFSCSMAQSSGDFLPKPGKNPQIPINYRPIALTSCLRKLTERMANSRLAHCLDEFGFLSKFQSGFRYGRGTIDNVLMLETVLILETLL
ncbi:hypothetical protein AVEN_174428-1 [Araneus ventricosus]|uniref:Uncharacterized protein n=1 Tax=Araneus ventricosus TaxID=182803 RepID=A0A4Y2SQA4_ARAVE|nr:hypothetical protein AVEN_174428-1 [Araneus ventricosus]